MHADWHIFSTVILTWACAHSDLVMSSGGSALCSCRCSALQLNACMLSIRCAGFMAFAAHSGFLQAVRDADVDVQGVCGTSSGALAGSLYCAGMTPEQVRLLCMNANAG